MDTLNLFLILEQIDLIARRFSFRFRFCGNRIVILQIPICIGMTEYIDLKVLLMKINQDWHFTSNE